jgi:RpiB/LacA/LacB family sugar-phosphate isomerase
VPRALSDRSFTVRIAFAADHAGFHLKQDLINFLRDQGHETIDLGAFGPDSVDYPDYAEKVAVAVREGRADRGIMICGSGVGGSVAANKVPGVRAGLCHDIYSARQGVEHDAMNVLVLGGRVIGNLHARELALEFIGARFSGEGRHQRRLDKIGRLEEHG